jgi:uncharacterized protein (DUF1778 family)
MSKHMTRTTKAPRSRPTAKPTAKTARVEARTTAKKKALYVETAARKGLTFTEFVEASLDEAAERAQQEFEHMELSRRAAKAFVAMMLSDDEPSPRLKAAAQRFKERTEA